MRPDPAPDPAGAVIRRFLNPERPGKGRLIQQRRSSMTRTFTTFACAAVLAAASPAFAQDNALERITEAGELRVCHADYIPYNFKDPESNEWQGTGVDLAENLAETLGVELVHVDATWATVVQNIVTDRCDISVAATYITPERAQAVLYTDPVGSDTVTAFVHTDSDAQTYADLDVAGNVIGVWSGTLEEQTAQTFFENAEVQPIVTDTMSTIMLEVANRRVDAIFASTAGPTGFLIQNDNVPVRAVGEDPINPTPFAFMLPKGEYHLQQYLNIWISTLEASGELDAIFDSWFDQF
jgi:ABC-type amino acid transport substrate-binding protein